MGLSEAAAAGVCMQAEAQSVAPCGGHEQVSPQIPTQEAPARLWPQGRGPPRLTAPAAEVVKIEKGNPLVVQGLELCALTAEGVGSVLG